MIFNSTIRFTLPAYDTDDELRSIEVAEVQLNRILKEQDIAFAVHRSMSSYDKFKEVILVEATRHKSNLIALHAGRNPKTTKVIQPKGLHQAMITNKLNIPVLCL
jgi:hypothetical protein